MNTPATPGPGEPGPAGPIQKFNARFPQVAGLQFQEYALALVVAVLFVTGAVLKPDTFPTADNIRNMLTQASVVGVIAIGMTFVIATSGIDLSVGSMVAAAGVAGAVLAESTRAPRSSSSERSASPC